MLWNKKNNNNCSLFIDKTLVLLAVEFETRLPLFEIRDFHKN